MHHSRLTLLVVGALLAACSEHDTTSPTIGSIIGSSAPAVTTDAPTTTGATATTGPPTTTLDSLPPEPVVVAPVDVGEWLAEQAAAGRVHAYVSRPDEPRLIVAAADNRASVMSLLVLGSVGFPVAAPQVAVGMLDVHAVLFGDVVALVQRGPDTVRLDLFDPATHRWSAGPALGVDGPFGNTWLYTSVVAGHLLVSAVTWADGMRPARQAGAVVAPDLTVRQMAAPPNGDIPMAWDVAGSTVAALLGLETQAETEHNLLRPWVYEPVANEWTELENPPGVDCRRDNGCGWFSMHEGVDFVVRSALPSGIVTTGPDGLWLLDEAGLGWTGLPTPSFDPSGATSWPLADGRLLVVPQSGWSTPAELGTIAILDVVAGSWTTTALPVSLSAAAGSASPVWVLRDAGEVLLLGVATGGADVGGDVPPQFVIDLHTGQWRHAVATDSVAWSRAVYGDATVTSLALAWAA